MNEINSDQSFPLRTDHLDILTHTCDELYLLSFTLQGANIKANHYEIIAEKLCKLSELIYEIIFDELSQRAFVEEEMKKFTQGFAYKPLNSVDNEQDDQND